MSKGKDCIGVSCGALIFNKEGKILIGKRGPAARDNIGLWDVPGGVIEHGEKCENAAKREVKEEFGIKIEVIELVHLVQFIKSGNHWIGPAYICRVLSGEAKPVEKDKFSDYKWVSVAEADKMKLTIPTRQIIDAYKKKIGIKNYDN
jgi:8-oxo-dGTP diphosphatase